jgi:hypothetical protein
VKRPHGAERTTGESGRIDREPGAAVGELLAQLIEPDPGLGRRREVRGLDGGHAVEPARGEREVGGRVAREPRSRALDAHAPPFLMRRAEQQRDRVGGAGRDARDAVVARFQHGAFAEQRGDFLENRHATALLLHSRQAWSGTTFPGFTRSSGSKTFRTACMAPRDSASKIMGI